MPRSFNASATPWSVVTPCAQRVWITGMMSAARLRGYDGPRYGAGPGALPGVLGDHL
jgi:hypothetical protein